MLTYPTSLSLFKKIQEKKIDSTQSLLQNLWLRGVKLIHEYQLYLLTSKN